MPTALDSRHSQRAVTGIRLLDGDSRHILNLDALLSLRVPSVAQVTSMDSEPVEELASPMMIRSPLSPPKSLECAGITTQDTPVDGVAHGDSSLVRQQVRHAHP